ncbi:MAG: transcription antitermination factor NusB [Holophagales bacterium]|jgi:N utilization substance protein B|nr:transcription antitermination factor NusB [Holophagales bacterium]
MGVRRRGREYALQMLFAMDLTEYNPDEVFAGFHAIQDLNHDAFYHARRMVDGIFSHLEEIDSVLANCAKNWKIPRMAVVDRNLLRLAIYELKFLSDAPFQIIINEALEIAKDFGDVESSHFINGILETAARELRPTEAADRGARKKRGKEPAAEAAPENAAAE